jgi:lipopolysaccharide/colanic/teichoic acid biosynthesis glycosyltransferase
VGHCSSDVSKRVLDVSVGAACLAAAGPALVAIAIAIKLGDGGPVLFRQTRIGRGGHPFGLVKFRTMVVGAERARAELEPLNERDGPLFKVADDPRVTPIGRFLRRTNLDELPQLFNVLAGSMSLVGPRPALPAEVAAFAPELRSRERVKPGITGPWQLQAGDDPSFESYRRLDEDYIVNWNITGDLRIIVATIRQAVQRVLRAPVDQAGR